MENITEKKRESLQSKTETLFFFLKGSKRYFILGIVFVFLQVIFDMINPKVMGYTVDYIVGDTQSIPGIVLTFVEKMGGRDDVLSHLWLIAIVIILFGIFGAVSRYLFRLFNSIGGENLARRMRNTLFEHILKLPYKWNDVNKTGYEYNLVSNHKTLRGDCSKIRERILNGKFCEERGITLPIPFEATTEFNTEKSVCRCVKQKTLFFYI